MRTVADLMAWRRRHLQNNPHMPHLVLAIGCFDLLHPGHIRHLEAAARFGDSLAVLVTPDRFVSKGPGRPVMNESLRTEMINALDCVDAAVVNDYPTAVEMIYQLKPSVLAKGWEYKSNMTDSLRAEIAALEAVGGRLIFTPESEFSTTSLVRAVKGCEPLNGVQIDEG